MNTTNCGHCGFDVNVDPCKCPIIPPNYPFNRPARDSYTFCCCGPSNPMNSKNPITAAYPSAGPFIGSAFAMNNGDPYLMDSTNMTYGQVLIYSESVYTRVSQRTDASCINLAATFDMTDTSLTNTVRNDFLKQYISRKYLELEGVLPIIKTLYKVRVHYTIRDIDGGTVNSTHVDTDIKDSHFHFTDIKDRYVQSMKGLIIVNIPAITYQGLYNISIDRVELMMNVINTKEHLVDAMNPYYTFIDNNQKIQLNSANIENTPADESITIASCDVYRAFDYHANVTNRLRLSFTAFTSVPIACGDTMGIWNALNEPTDAVIAQLRNEVTALEDEVTALHARDDAQQTEIDELKGQVTLNTNNIAALTARVATLESANTNKDRIIEEILGRLEALERIPLALVAYKEGQQFIRSQITWLAYGNLYQATRDFVASGSFMQDVGLGYLVPVIKEASPYDALLERVADIETTANDASSTATATAETVDAMSSSVSELQEQTSTLNDQVSAINGTLETVESDINTLQDDVNDLKFDKDSKTKVIITNTTTGERQLANSYGAAATIVKSAEDGSFTITCGEEYSQQTIAADTFKDATRLTEITFPASITTIASTAFDGCDEIIINIPKETDSVTGSPWGATNATVNWNE